MLEVDLEHPSELHDLHSDYPLAPEKFEVSQNMLSKYCSDIADKYGIKIGGVSKLVPNLGNKSKDVVPYRNIQLYLSLGMKLTKVHRILKFKQSDWLKKYIDFNNEKRKKFSELIISDFEKDLFELMNNSVFGKTMENIRKQRDIKLVTTDKKRSKLVSEPNYHTINLISEDLSIIEMKKTKVKMNKPIYLGLSILEISKILMYEFWYDYMKPKYNDNVRLRYMDTDSFIMNIKTNYFYKDISDDVDNRFDTSNCEVKRPLPIGKNKKVIGLMKDELEGEIITEFIALRPKTYSYLTDNGKIDKKAKGTKKCVIKKMIKFDDYKKCLLNDKVILTSQHKINTMYIRRMLIK